MDSTQCMSDIYAKATSDIADLEIWPGYYKLRYEEFSRFMPLFPCKEFDQALEIGCGIGYQSALLACLSNKVMATDVDFGQMKKHSRGINLAREFIVRLGKKNIEIKIADAQQLPFANESFDFIYCSYSFQYIPDKNKALKEIHRVLKKEGYFFCVVPTAVYTTKIGFKNYWYLVKRIFKKKNQTGEETIQKNTINKKRKWYDYFKKLAPLTDDADNSFIGELFDRFPAKWKKLFTKNGYNTQVIFPFKQRFFAKTLLSFFSESVVLLSKKINE